MKQCLGLIFLIIIVVLAVMYGPALYADLTFGPSLWDKITFEPAEPITDESGAIVSDPGNAFRNVPGGPGDYSY